MTKRKYENNIKESQIEDALVSNLDYLRHLLGLEHELRLITRQFKMHQDEQRLDLLLSHGNEVCLIELKVTPFEAANLAQIKEYRNEIRELQVQEKIVQGPIQSYLLVTRFTTSNAKLCETNDVKLVAYSPIEVMENYFQNLAALAPFLKIKPNDYGVFNLGLINRTLGELGNGKTLQSEIATSIQLSSGSIKNHLRLGKEFGLIRQRGARFQLTDRGDKFVNAAPMGALNEELSPRQADILKEYVADNPFASSAVFGIYAIAESAFHLSRNSYPIYLDDLRTMFRTVSGKNTEWRAIKSVSTATYTYLNYAIDLGLLGKIGKQIVITPSGFQFILMLQLHKSIEMVESLAVNR